MAQAYNQFSPLNALAYVQEQGEMGRARGQQNQLAQLASQSYGANTPEQRQQLLTSMAVVNPAAAQSQQQQFQGNEDRQRKLAYGAATYLKGALDTKNPAAIAGAWRSVRPGLINAGIGTEADYAQDWQPEYEQVLHQILASGSGGSNGAAGVQSTYVDDQGQRVAIMRDGSTQILGGNDAGANQQSLSIDINGTPTQVTFDRRTGRYSNASLGAPAAAAPAAPQGGYQNLGGQATYIDPSLPAEVQAQIRQSLSAGQEVPSQMVLAGSGGGVPLTGRRAEDQAAATEAARLGVQQAYLPQELSMRTDAAIQQAGGTAQAKGEAEARLDAVQNLPRVMQESTNAVNLIDQALSHPGLATSVGASGRADPRNYLPGTDATDFRVLLDQIKGGTFLQAFQSLKGGGAITEVEGTKAEQAIARLNRDQSEQAFRQSLQDLREVANAAMVRAQAKAQAAGAQGGQGGSAPARIQSAADYNALPSGALFIAPDGSQRRKR
ncbi:hypothetical protein [Stenotrophomonas sp. NPDC078853]|uniref:hypothetical protein n=1 Tax=Stenotrophomonas sp. NPDC078853 TaxID=3364534 RepID=UPI00384C0861